MSPALWSAIVNQIVSIIFFLAFIVGGGWLLKSALGRKLHGFKIPGVWPPAQTSPLAAAGEVTPFYGRVVLHTHSSGFNSVELEEFARGWITRDGLLWRISPTQDRSDEYVRYAPVNLAFVERLQPPHL